MEKILADTSAWIASFSKSGHEALKETMKETILSGRLCLTGMVQLELLQGTRHEKDCETLRKKLSVLPFLSVDDTVWLAVAHFSLALRRQGVVVPIPDLFIAHVALKHDCILMHMDRDFERIASRTSLKTLSFL